MKFCADHWDQLRAAIEARGLSSLVSDSGEKAISNLVSETNDGPTIDNFDPLMSAHNSIWSNAMTVIERTYMQNPLMLMADDPEHPEWACPICCLNWIHADHDEHCTKEGCDYPKGRRYEWMIDRAADDMAAEWKRLRD